MFSEIAGRRTADSSSDRKHMFHILAKTSRFASMRTESGSCRVLVIKRGLNANDGFGEDDGSLPERVR